MLPQLIDSATLWAVPFWIALGVASAVKQNCEVSLDLVWPNDLYVRGGKVGGILSVARIAGNDAWVGCGVGLNVARPGGDADLEALQPQPAFLADLAPRVERESLLAAILCTFDRSFNDLRDTAGIVARWEQWARLAGTTYRYRNDADGIERDGIAQRIGPHGALILSDATGERKIEMADVRITGRDGGEH
jgi:biotin-(acetyl-CoA carboxylase) ligase